MIFASLIVMLHFVPPWFPISCTISESCESQAGFLCSTLPVVLTSRKKGFLCVASQSEEVRVMHRATRLQHWGLGPTHKQPIVVWHLVDWCSGWSDHCTGLKHSPAQQHLLIGSWLSCWFFCIWPLEVS